MSHFAKLENGIVTQVIVAEQDVIDTGLFGVGWIKTSYNTKAGQHPEGRPFRKNYAGVGFTYDYERDAFIPPKPYASWTLNEETCLWDCPVDYPIDGNSYVWDEDVLNWVLFENLTQTTIQNISNDSEITLTSSYGMNGADSISNQSDSIIISADSINGAA
jgi:hypothetical protein